jgi:uncharacterized protein (TIGR00369 family)
VPRLKQRTAALRERGLASALAVLAEQGPAGLTTRTVAHRAEASVPAIYEVFGDKSGLIREVFFEGFRMLGDELAAVPPAGDPVTALRRACDAFRRFVTANPVLAQVMFSRPFTDFEPTAEDNKAGLRVSEVFVHHARLAVDAGLLAGNPADIAHLFFAFAEGLAAAESAHRLGGAEQSVDRRWSLGLDALVEGLRLPAGPAALARGGAAPVSGSGQRPEPAPAPPPDGFIPYRRPSPYLELVGPVYEAAAAGPLVAGLWLDRRHTNSRGFAHAGLLVALADTVLGHTILREFPGSPPVVTVSLTTDFTGSAHQGTWLQGEAKVTRRGSRLSFATCVFRAGDRVVMTATGIFASQPGGSGEAGQ